MKRPAISIRLLCVPRAVLLLGAVLCAGEIQGATLRGSVSRESFATDAIAEPVRYELYLPPGHGDGKGLPYLLFLPGYKDDETFCRKKRFFEITERMIEGGRVPAMAVVCAGRGRSPAAIWIDGYGEKMNYETALLRDLLGRLERAHGLAADRTRRGILGISIGGFAALKISLRHPELFGSVSALSPALDPHYQERVRSGGFPWEAGGEDAHLRMFGSGFDVARALREDPFWLVENGTEPITARYFLTCGTEDRHGLAEPLSRFRDLLIRSGATVEGGLERGNHDPSFWRRIYPEALRVHAAVFEAPSP